MAKLMLKAIEAWVREYCICGLCRLAFRQFDTAKIREHRLPVSATRCIVELIQNACYKQTFVNGHSGVTPLV